MAYLCGDHCSERVWILMAVQDVVACGRTCSAGQRLNIFPCSAVGAVHCMREFESGTMAGIGLKTSLSAYAVPLTCVFTRRPI